MLEQNERERIRSMSEELMVTVASCVADEGAFKKVLDGGREEFRAMLMRIGTGDVAFSAAEAVGLGLAVGVAASRALLAMADAGAVEIEPRNPASGLH